MALVPSRLWYVDKPTILPCKRHGSLARRLKSSKASLVTTRQNGLQFD